MQSSSQLCHPQHFSLPPSSRFYPLNSQTLSTSSHLLQHPNATHHSHRILLYNFLSPYIYDHSENHFPKCSHRSFSKWSSHGITLLFTQNSVASHSLQIKTCFSVLHGLVSTLPFQILLITTTLFQPDVLSTNQFLSVLRTSPMMFCLKHPLPSYNHVCCMSAQIFPVTLTRSNSF